MSSLQKENAKYLWWALQGLGFQQGAAAASAGVSKANVRHISLGMNMFDKPNKDAFYIVTYFLFEKLNPARVHQLFRYCWPVLDRKADAEFRKVTFAWVRDIAAEYGNAFPRVVASLFLSPGGPKFINLMFHLAKHVMLQEMKSFSTDTWVPEAVATKAQSIEIATKRFQLVKSRFLSSAVEQDCIVQSYQRKAQTLVKSIRDLRAEEAKYDNLLTRQEQEGEQEKIVWEKITKVRSLWTDFNKILSSLTEERVVVESVVKGNVDEYVLDGTDRTLKIPRPLLEQIEKSCQMVNAGNVYEAGQLNILRLLELLKEALILLEQERAAVGGPAPLFDLQCMEEQALLLGRTLDTLRVTGWKITKEVIPEVKTSIQNMEEAWDRKWTENLGQTPLKSFLNEDPALKFLPPMAPLSFEPATEANFKFCVFSQYPAKLPEDELPTDPPSGGISACVGSVSKKDHAPESCPAEVPVREMVASPAPSRPSTPCGPPRRSMPCCNPSPATSQASVAKRASMRDMRPRVTGAKKKAAILDQEYDNLADQFAEAVTSSSADGSMGLDLEDLLSCLSDPFSTRKQLPRTPDSLISDVKSSWRRALEEGEAEKARLSGQLGDCAELRYPAPAESHEAACARITEPLLGAGVLQVLDIPNQAQESLHSTLPWDSEHMGVGNAQSDSSDVIQFGIASETMPDLLGNESLSSSDEPLQEEEEFTLPLILPNHVTSEGELQPTCIRLHKVQQAYNMSVCPPSMTPELQSPQHRIGLSPEEAGWETGEKVFSLDLDALESPSPSKGRFSLPKLVTFSPLDDS